MRVAHRYLARRSTVAVVVVTQRTAPKPLEISPGLRLIFAFMAAALLGALCIGFAKGSAGSAAKVALAYAQSKADAQAATTADSAAKTAAAAVVRAPAKQKAVAQRAVSDARVAAANAHAKSTASASALQKEQAAQKPAAGSAYFVRYGLLAVAFLWLVSFVLAGDANPLALAMGLDNRLSTSKFQALLWTACVGFVYSMIYADRVITYGNVDPITDVPQNVLFALGISVASAVGAKAITSSQVAADPNHKDAQAAPSYDPSALVRDDGSSTASLTKVQILFWTVIAIVVYITSALHYLPVIAPCPVNCTFPDIDTTLMIFMGLGHATYLGGKLVGGATPQLSKVTEENGPGGKTLILAGSSLGSSGVVLVNGEAVKDELIQSWTATSIRFTLADPDGGTWSAGDKITLAVNLNGNTSPAITYIYAKPPVPGTSLASTSSAAVQIKPPPPPPPPPSRVAASFRGAPPPPAAKPTGKALRWGVDTSGNVTQGLIDDATGRIQKPAFWGRYLTGYPVTAGEIVLLKQQQIRLLPIYQGTTAHPNLLSGDVSGQQGAKDAVEAIGIARDTHGIPTNKGIAIYADIEPEYDVSHYWLSAWIRELTAVGYIGGIYCGSNQPGIIAGMSRLIGVDPTKVIIWSCMPHDTTKTTKADVPVAFGTPGFSVGGVVFPVEMWQYCLDYGDYDFNVCSDRAFDAMWQP
jgi:hypothetical protein